ncbi:MAG: ATP-grasp enzyme-like protein [Gemmatimonadetes bacterium]|nr:ATP-grasp enzyme-like protein [Gemmatimonadota bacterium]
MRVLLLDEGFISGTATARGLRAAGCTVDVIAATGGHGRCIVAGGTWQLAPRVGNQRLMDMIDAAVRRTEYDIIYPITEPLQALIWDQQPGWQSKVFPRVSTRQQHAQRDKRAMSALVANAGVSIPHELPATSATDVRDAVRKLGLPIVIKGTTGRGGNATRICSSLDSAIAASKELTTNDQHPFAQQYIDGVTYLAGGLFDRGRPLRFFSGAKTLQYPSRTGPAAEITSVRDPALTDLALRVFAAAQVTGLASIDVVRDAHGRYHFLELNPRPWGSIEAAGASGVDLFDALARLWREEPVSPRLDFADGVRSPVFPLYLFAMPYWKSGAARRALGPDVRRAFTLARGEPALAGHVAHRLVRVGLNLSAPRAGHA